MTSVRVTRVIRGWDMRQKHKARETFMRHLRPGEAAVLLNGDLKMARLIDAVGGVHDYYAPPRQKFDEATLYNMIERGFRLTLRVGHDEHRIWKRRAA